MKKLNLIGEKFGRLVVTSKSKDCGRDIKWVCKCLCGEIRKIYAGNLKSGKTRSCGCFNIESHTTHGYNKGKVAQEYKIWASMIQRCHNPNDKSYKNYGKRGIIVCDAWRASFLDFIEHVGKRPHCKLSLDRVNNDGNYEPGNVKWSTRTEQMLNTRRSLRYRFSKVGLSQRSSRLNRNRERGVK